MKFNESQREFINTSIHAELRSQRGHIKWYTELIEQEGPNTFGYKQILERHVKKMQELEALLKIVNTVE